MTKKSHQIFGQEESSPARENPGYACASATHYSSFAFALPRLISFFLSISSLPFSALSILVYFHFPNIQQRNWKSNLSSLPPQLKLNFVQ